MVLVSSARCPYEGVFVFFQLCWYLVLCLQIGFVTFALAEKNDNSSIPKIELTTVYHYKYSRMFWLLFK